MQNLKLFAFAVLGAGLLAINVTTTTGCEASAEATGGASGSDGGSGSGNTAGTSAAGTGGSGGAAAGSGGSGGSGGDSGGAAGSGGGTTAPASAASLAKAYGTGDACSACLVKMTGKSTQEDKIDCGAVLTACDADKGCADFIATLEDARTMKPTESPDCWTFTAISSTNNAPGNDLAICTVEQCGKECGGGDGSTFTKGFLTECK